MWSDKMQLANKLWLLPNLRSLRINHVSWRSFLESSFLNYFTKCWLNVGREICLWMTSTKRENIKLKINFQLWNGLKEDSQNILWVGGFSKSFSFFSFPFLTFKIESKRFLFLTQALGIAIFVFCFVKKFPFLFSFASDS
jgi:hypothetical protein